MSENMNELLRITDIIVKNAVPQKIFLFGSRARGNARHDSDYDICVIVKDGPGTLTRELEKQLYYLMTKAGIRVPVDLLVTTESKFEELKDNHYLVYNQVDRNGKKIYEKITAA